MAVIHITEAEAARDLSAVLAKASAGEEIEIAGQTDTFLLVRSQSVKGEQGLVLPRHRGGDKPRLLSEILADLKKNPLPRTEPDLELADAIEAGIREREHERLTDSWESF